MLAAASKNACSFAARRDLLVAHKEDLSSLCLIMHWGPRDRQALASDVRLFSAALPDSCSIKAIGQQDSEPVPAGMLDACKSVSLALQNAVYVIQKCGRDADMDPGKSNQVCALLAPACLVVAQPHPWCRPCLDAAPVAALLRVCTDVMPEWSAAVKPIIRQLQQLKQQGTGQGQADGDSSVARAGAFLQQIWFLAATSTVHRPAVFNSRVLASMPYAAELAALLLAVPGAVEAPREDIPEPPLGSNTQLVTSLGLSAASCSINVTSQYLCMQGDSLLAAPASVPPAPVSDAVQVAAALHTAVLLAAHDQRQAAGQGSGFHLWLQQLGFPMGLAQA